MNSDLKYKYVFDENDNIVIADQTTEYDKLNHTYHICGIDANNGQPINELVYPVIGKKRRNYFRRYTQGAANRQENFTENMKQYNETVLHKLAKKVIKEQVKSMTLPQALRQVNGTTVQTEAIQRVRPIDIELEKMFMLPDNSYVKYDAYLKDVISQRELGIEFAITSKVDKNKAEKIKQLNHEVIEIDLSWLVDINETVDFVAIIKTILENGTEYCKWINNKSMNNFDKWLDGQVYFDTQKTQYQLETDGAWYFWAGDKKQTLKHCKYRDKIASSTEYGKRYLCEKECLGCDRLSILRWDGKTGRIACNQSEISNSIILGMIMRGLEY